MAGPLEFEPEVGCGSRQRRKCVAENTLFGQFLERLAGRYPFRVSKLSSLVVLATVVRLLRMTAKPDDDTDE
jgi:hypothetical protein